MQTNKINEKLLELIRLFRASSPADGGEILTQITYLLFLRWISDFRGNAINNAKEPRIFTLPFFKKIRWDIFCDEEPSERFELYLTHVISFLGKTRFTGNSIHDFPHSFKNLINSPEMLSEVVRLINEAFELAKDNGWDNIKAYGEIYDCLLNECFSSNMAGQYCIPRHLARFMCALVKPIPTDRIIDPACGIGNLLVSAVNNVIMANAMRAQLVKDEDGLNAVDDVRNVVDRDNYMKSVIGERLFGCDINEQVVFFCAMNMVFHGVACPKIFMMDSLSATFDNEMKPGSYNVVLSDIPISPFTSIDNLSPRLRSFQTKKSEAMFLLRAIELLADGGRAAVILHEGALFSGGSTAKKIRKKLMDECRIEAIVSLPPGVFLPLSGVKASIIVFTKTRTAPSESVWFYELANDGYSLNKNRRKLTENPLAEAVEWFDNKKVNDKAFQVDVTTIRINNYDLSSGRYKIYDVPDEPSESPYEILADILKSEEELAKCLTDLKSMIK